MVHCIKDVKILDRHGMGLSNETLALLLTKMNNQINHATYKVGKSYE